MGPFLGTGKPAGWGTGGTSPIWPKGQGADHGITMRL